MPYKVASPVNLQNHFSSLMVTNGHKFKRQLIIVSVLKFKTQNLNQELKKSNAAVYELREKTIIMRKLKIQ